MCCREVPFTMGAFLFATAQRLEALFPTSFPAVLLFFRPCPGIFRPPLFRQKFPFGNSVGFLHRLTAEIVVQLVWNSFALDLCPPKQPCFNKQYSGLLHTPVLFTGYELCPLVPIGRPLGITPRTDLSPISLTNEPSPAPQLYFSRPFRDPR